jgi:hypothetical protein
MAFVRRKDSRPVIDLSGPGGNVFALIGYGRNLCRQLGTDPKAFSSEMMAGDYRHALKTFDKHFGEYVDLVGADLEDDE